MPRYCMSSVSISSNFLGVEIMGVVGLFGVAVLESKPEYPCPGPHRALQNL